MKLKNSLRAGLSGVTLIEAIIAMLIIGILAVPLSRYVSVMLRSLMGTAAKTEGESTILKGTVPLDRDFRDINEILVGGPRLMRFIMDSHRAPWYSPTGDLDGDTIINVLDPDDDNDGLAAGALMYHHVGVSPNPGGSPPGPVRSRFPTPRLAGLDLDDDDDNYDGKIDVICRYEWNSVTNSIRRSFYFDAPNIGVLDTDPGWKPWETILTNVISATFTYVGAVTQSDLPAVPDLNGDGVLNQSELLLLDPATDGMPLDRYLERRWITLVIIDYTLRPNPKLIDKIYPFHMEISPPLLPNKRKYR